ncbi:hypothetical protein C8259_17295 [Nocardia nova]|uniref:Uncharacterized protein n=1 Tax=Nocardia nova TaxID=37330 RepID=A0A2T2Z2C5_9NOCA|nr:hypothetical protein C8259_17295 [Nocardia nova]
MVGRGSCAGRVTVERGSDRVAARAVGGLARGLPVSSSGELRHRCGKIADIGELVHDLAAGPVGRMWPA